MGLRLRQIWLRDAVEGSPSSRHAAEPSPFVTDDGDYMPRNWIKWTKGLHERREVIVISKALGISTYELAGKLMAIWEWADGETSDGFLAGVTPEFIDAKVSQPGLFSAIESAGWGARNDGGITFTNWEKNNGECAKKRLEDAERQQKSRDKQRKPASRKRHKNVTKLCDKSVTRPDQIREDKTRPDARPEPGKEIQDQMPGAVCESLPDPAGDESGSNASFLDSGLASGTERKRQVVYELAVHRVVDLLGGDTQFANQIVAENAPMDLVGRFASEIKATPNVRKKPALLRTKLIAAGFTGLRRNRGEK